MCELYEHAPINKWIFGLLIMFLLAAHSAMEAVASLGGAEGPFEMILDSIGGPMPSGQTWQRMRSWGSISRTISRAWMEYNRDIETLENLFCH